MLFVIKVKQSGFSTNCSRENRRQIYSIHFSLNAPKNAPKIKLPTVPNGAVPRASLKTITSLFSDTINIHIL